jgi:hypothetical protein
LESDDEANISISVSATSSLCHNIKKNSSNKTSEEEKARDLYDIRDASKLKTIK